ncbi:uncharacterized protein MONBRDRAFT_33763 [Monosiga brevicollis MX1]|uniref:VOC domain-containing protein n=1 Tax=Monosiga brevicollis TaxID=81824 RepID=A9V7B5_MONBE|nr:uncharacterized protein MONBRDRAFT_33763 [Monosiga brevicollis MX1]EDQ86554.1 predicted protein [Monosiga brevicollis MX1]|eukprot:XP_001748667.1 hypothetical protein [Monosiga brevicollis MX1]
MAGGAAAAGERMAPLFLQCVDHIGIQTANVSRTVDFYKTILGCDHKYSSEVDFGFDPALMTCPGNNSGVALCPGSSRGLSYIAFRVSEHGFAHAQKLLKARNIPFKLKGKHTMQGLIFTDPINGYQIWLTCWPKSKTSHATRQIPRSAIRKVAARSFFGGLLSGVVITAAVAIVALRYVDK